ncbi:MAG: phosphoglycolate phosphatase [Thiotrichaceae bacterium]
MTTYSPTMVLIDVDGTLVDSVPDLAYCVDEMLIKLGMEPHGEAAVRNWVGNGVVRLVERGLTNNLDGHPDPELFEKAMPIFNDLYSVHHSDRSTLYPGVKEGLEFLQAAKNVKIGCVTNKAEAFTIPILKALGIHDEFETIICGDTLEKKKPDPMPLLHACTQLGVLPENSMMLGDSKSDVKAARAAGFSIICMSYGYNHGEDIRNYDPDEVIDSMTELTQLLDI